MRNVFETVCREVNVNGAKFLVDFKKRSLKLNDEYLIKDGGTYRKRYAALCARELPLPCP